MCLVSPFAFLPLPATEERGEGWGEGNPNKNGPPLHEPSLFSPQIQGYRRLGFLSICGSPESVGKPAFRGPPGTALPGGLAEALAGTFTGRLSPIWSESNLI